MVQWLLLVISKPLERVKNQRRYTVLTLTASDGIVLMKTKPFENQVYPCSIVTCKVDLFREI